MMSDMRLPQTEESFTQRRERLDKMVVDWARDLLEGNGNDRYLGIIKNFLRKSPSGLENLSTDEWERLQQILNSDT